MRDFSECYDIDGIDSVRIRLEPVLRCKKRNVMHLSLGESLSAVCSVACLEW